MTKTDNQAEIGMHVFERAGLGRAPFSIIGYEFKQFKAHPGAPAQCGGSCDYCGTGISQMFKIRSSDGRIFKVGCDCVEKTGDHGLIQAYKRNPAYRRQQLAARHSREQSKIEVLQANFEAIRPILATIENNRGPSKTRADYYDYVLRQCGTSGKIKWLKAAITEANNCNNS